MGANCSVPGSSGAELKDDASNNVSNTKKSSNEISDENITDDSDNEESRLKPSNEALNSSNNSEFQSISIPEDEQFILEDKKIHSETAAYAEHSNNYESTRGTSVPLDSPENTLELSTIASVPVDGYDEYMLVEKFVTEILNDEMKNEESNVKDSDDRELSKRKIISEDVGSDEPPAKKQKIADESINRESETERERTIQLERMEMKADRERLKRENRLKWGKSYRKAVATSIASFKSSASYKKRVGKKPRYLALLLQALQVQDDHVPVEEKTVQKSTCQENVERPNEPPASEKNGECSNNGDDDGNVLRERRIEALQDLAAEMGFNPYESAAKTDASSRSTPTGQIHEFFKDDADDQDVYSIGDHEISINIDAVEDEGQSIHDADDVSEKVEESADPGEVQDAIDAASSSTPGSDANIFADEDVDSEEADEVKLKVETIDINSLSTEEKSVKAIVQIDSRETIDVGSSDSLDKIDEIVEIVIDDESQDQLHVLPQDSKDAENIPKSSETSSLKEVEEPSQRPPERLINPFFKKKCKEKKNRNVTLQLPETFKMEYVEITISPIPNSKDVIQIPSIEILPENPEIPEIDMEKKTKAEVTSMGKKSRDKKLTNSNRVNDSGRKSHNALQKEIVEIDLVDSDD